MDGIELVTHGRNQPVRERNGTVSITTHAIGEDASESVCDRGGDNSSVRLLVDMIRAHARNVLGDVFPLGGTFVAS